MGNLFLNFLIQIRGHRNVRMCRMVYGKFDDSWWIVRGRHGRDRMIVGFTTTYATSEFEPAQAGCTQYNIML